MRVEDEDYICLTDMAAGKGDDVRAADVIKNWLRARYTLEFLGTWEQLHNPTFNVVEFDLFKAQAGLPNFVLSADVLNVALFGKTHQQWQFANPDLKGNQRDYADINQLICLSNMENLNAVMIQDGIAQSERLRRLNEIAIHQMKVLANGMDSRRLLK